MASRIVTGVAASRARLDDHVVVDLDVHILDGKASLLPYLDEPWRTVLETHAIPPFTARGRPYPTFPGQWKTRQFHSPTPAQMRADLDDLGIDIGVLFSEAMHQIGSQPNRAYAMALTRAFNRWQFEHYTPIRGFYAPIQIAPQDPEASAREIERYAGERQCGGVMIPAQRMDPLWGDARFDPIYETAEKYGLAAHFHGGGPVQIPMLPFDLRQFDTPFLFHTYTHPVEMAVSLAHLISTGVPVRFPRLKMVFIEAGVSWVLMTLLRLDRAWEEMRGDVPYLTEKPSAYMRRMYFATQPIEEPEDLRHMANLIRIIGEDTILFASDYPHHDFDHPKKVYDIPLSAAGRRKVMGESALGVLGIARVTPADLVPGKRLPGWA